MMVLSDLMKKRAFMLLLSALLVSTASFLHGKLIKNGSLDGAEASDGLELFTAA